MDHDAGPVREDAQAARDLAYWLERPPEERIAAVEFLRAQYYRMRGDASVPRIVRAVRLRDR